MPAVSATDAVRVMVGTDRVLLVFGQIALETAPEGLGAACDVGKRWWATIPGSTHSGFQVACRVG
jgi:hypothetical protein